MNIIKSFEQFVNESLQTNEAARIPYNVLDFAKRKGSYATSLVKKAATWAEKAGKYISGGTAIGKDYMTIILDMKHQGSEIYINLNNETIELFGEEVTDAKSFKKVLDENSANESIVEAKMDIFPGYNNGLDADEYQKEFKKTLSKVKDVEFNMSSTSMMYLKSSPNMADVDLTKDIQKALTGFDDNLDLDNITSNIGKPGLISPNDQQKGIVSYQIPKHIDWWTLKRAAGKEKPSTETVLTDEIIFSILDRMAQVSTTQDQLANTAWTSLEELLRAAGDHMSSTNYKKFYKEIKKKYPKIS